MIYLSCINFYFFIKAPVEEIEDSDRDTDGEMPKPKAPLEVIINVCTAK